METWSARRLRSLHTNLGNLSTARSHMCPLPAHTRAREGGPRGIAATQGRAQGLTRNSLFFFYQISHCFW
jgi:hypothetical protein